MSDGDWTIVVGLAMLAGMVGVVVPFLPGLVVIWAATIVYGLAVGFGMTGIAVVAVSTTLLGISFVTSMTLPKRHAEASGASSLSMMAATVGAIAGFFIIPIIGLIVGAVVGLAAAEYLAKRDRSAAWSSTKGILVGFGLSTLVDVALGLMMIGTWVIWAAFVLDGF